VLSVQRETRRGHGDDDNGLREVVVRSPAVRWTTCGESHRWVAMNRMTRDEQIAFAVSDMARMRGHAGHE
jgi:hypothetical protein